MNRGQADLPDSNEKRVFQGLHDQLAQFGLAADLLKHLSNKSLSYVAIGTSRGAVTNRVAASISTLPSASTISQREAIRREVPLARGPQDHLRSAAIRRQTRLVRVGNEGRVEESRRIPTNTACVK